MSTVMWTEVREFGVVMFITIAGVLGTGILGLPVSLWQTGFQPFLVMMTASSLAQAGVVLAMVELLQRAVVAVAGEESASLLELEKNSVASDRVRGASLHSLATLFLRSRWMRWIFETFVMAHFVALMTSYGLAGPQSIAHVLGIGIRWLPTTTFVFVCSCTILITFFLSKITDALSLSTAIKGTLLMVLIAVIGAVGQSYNQHFGGGWSGWSGPFLMGTVAIGGVANVMPYSWSVVVGAAPTREKVARYRAAILLAILICYVVNILWCYSILSVVPQQGPSPSLENANRLGQISTVPLLQQLQQNGGTSLVVGVMVDAFIFVSVFVSFMTIGASLKNMLDGYADDFGHESDHAVKRYILYVIWFGIVLILACLNPRGFVKILETYAALCLNIEAGFFILYMYFNARTSDDLSIPLKLSRAWGTGLCSAAIVFYVFAVAVDALWVPILQHN